MPQLEALPAHVKKAYGIYLLSAQHRHIKQLKTVAQPSVHGHKTWESSFLIMDYLRERPIPKRRSLLELGCGWGPASIYCARQFNAKVTGVDIDEAVFPYLDVMASYNDVGIHHWKSAFNDIKVKDLRDFEVLVGADICFWDSLTDELFRLIKRAKRGGVQRIVLADPGRPTFEALIARCQRTWPEATTHEVWYATEPKRTTGHILDIRF
ncbi:SAM-dependent methyltransferase [Bacterioplanes sanyensis]|uniref:SAM-dependent methyltransferase n=1 Tax=Bacterioplanes sanyensis TaxID=1249553 RepID=A0A222FM20_9GAMM|nr:methyltransferase domain-containing protein [Bacterioplanes sanyensis]ASP40067.1 SAM-dependent methyltransferase [Bacterioplanes sanyensis]